MAARKVLISTVENRGFGWRDYVQELEQRFPLEARDDILNALSDPDLIYPDYYRWQFHGYQDGNLAWLPAFEAEPATMAMSVRVYKKETHLKCEEASARLRKSYLQLRAYRLWAQLQFQGAGCWVRRWNFHMCYDKSTL
jgi:hypothetical protein